MSVVQETPELISLTTIFSLGATAAILFTAYLTSLTLPKPTPIKTRILFIWHAFDALIHFTLEGSFLYTVFTTSIPLPAPTSSTSTSGASHLFSSLTGLSTVSDPSTNLLPGFPHAANFPITPPAAPFLGDASRLYGAFYGSSPAALLWQEYARADARWGGSDLTVISLELLTVFVMAPLAVWICYALRKGDGRAWFAMVVVATGELYGGEYSVYYMKNYANEYFRVHDILP